MPSPCRISAAALAGVVLALAGCDTVRCLDVTFNRMEPLEAVEALAATPSKLGSLGLRHGSGLFMSLGRCTGQPRTQALCAQLWVPPGRVARFRDRTVTLKDRATGATRVVRLEKFAPAAAADPQGHDDAPLEFVGAPGRGSQARVLGNFAWQEHEMLIADGIAAPAQLSMVLPAFELDAERVPLPALSVRTVTEHVCVVQPGPWRP
jgi:hypothetical protein